MTSVIQKFETTDSERNPILGVIRTVEPVLTWVISFCARNVNIAVSTSEVRVRAFCAVRSGEVVRTTCAVFVVPIVEAVAVVEGEFLEECVSFEVGDQGFIGEF
jgi:hypothetical protein